MNTLLTRSPEEAASRLRRGGLVAFPTETVYGLGADAFDAAAVRRIFEVKERPADNPLIVHVAAEVQVSGLVQHVPEAARQLMEHFFPGPLTLILPRRERVPDAVTAGLNTVGVRMPRHALAQSFLSACGTPVAAPSANRSGRPSPTNWQAVQSDLGGRIDAILQGGRTDAGLESTVVDCTDTPLMLLRAGALPLEKLRAALPHLSFASSSDGPGQGRSPGTRHRHYAPRARLVLVDKPDAIEASADQRAAYIGLDRPPCSDTFAELLVCQSMAHYGRELFHFFRLADAAGCPVIYAQRVEAVGLGRALMDRLQRAAAG